jgi:hypothetical protein
MRAEVNVEEPVGRLRRGLFGYRRSDVEIELARLRLAIQQLRHGLETGWRRRSELEEELKTVRDELARLRAREDDVVAAVAAIARRAEEQPAATEPAAVAAADVQTVFAATEAKAAALREDLTRQVNELLGVKDTLVHQLRGVMHDFGEALGRVERGEQLLHHDESLLPPFELHLPTVEAHASRGSVVGDPEARERVYPETVELDVGPFADFAALSAFERALASLPKVEDVHVRRFTGERALIELASSEPLRLLDHVDGALPYDLEVVEAGDGHVTLTVLGVRTTAGAR